ncbi:MAG TPA: hypothetical protein VKA34_22830 [Balneolales bacterium]|nr:hypothetical protein [Balneolales bacterium]
MQLLLEDFAKPFFCPISVFSRLQNPHIWLICCGSEVAQALILNKSPGFAKPSIGISGLIDVDLGRLSLYLQQI